MERENTPNKNNSTSWEKQESYQPPPPPPYTPEQYPQPSQYPPPPPPPPTYYPPSYGPQSIYSWEMFPHLRRDLFRQRESKKPIFALIGVFLLITFSLEFPIAIMLAYYGSSDGLDFGGTFTLEGEIKGEDGNGLSGVRVDIVGTDLSAISDSEGNYRIQNAPNGIWKIKISRAGYTEEEHRVLIIEGFIETADFQLKEGTGSMEFNDVWFFYSLTIVIILFSGFIIAGSYYSFKRKRFGVVLVGSILGIFTMTPVLVLGFIRPMFIMGMIGFVFSSSALLITIMNRKLFIPSSPKPTQIEESELPLKEETN